MTDAWLGRQQHDWEDLAETDPLWAILSDPARRDGRWEADDFCATGEQETEELLELTGSLGYPHARDRALDFGCGVGRVTRALAARFGECDGVDISERMIELARQMNADRGNAHFHVNVSNTLPFGDDSFDLVYSTLVLQHQPTRAAAERYVAEFLRVTRPGGIAVFQMLSRIPRKMRLQPGRRAYTVLRRAGLSEQFLVGRARLVPMRGTAISEPAMQATVRALGGQVVKMEHDARGRGVESTRYFAVP